MKTKLLLTVTLSILLLFLSINSISAAWTQDMNNGLTSYYAFNESAGTTLTNQLHNVSRDGNFITGTPNWSVGLIGNGVHFSGTANEVFNMSYTIDSTAGTFGCWYRPNSLATEEFFAGGIITGSTNEGEWYLRRVDNGGDKAIQFHIDNATTGKDIQTRDLESTDKYAQIVFTWNATNGYRLYLNASLDATVEGTKNPPIMPYWAIGGRYQLNTGNIDESSSLMDECWLSNRTWTSDEITENFNNGLGSTYTDSFGPTVSLTHPKAIVYNLTKPNTVAYTNSSNADRCWFSLDGGVTNSTNVKCGNNMSISAGDISEGSNTLNLWANDSTAKIGGDSVTFTFNSYVVNSLTYSATTYETFTETFSTNITLASGVSLSSAQFNYNGTRYSPVISSSGNNRILNNTIIIPAVSTTENLTFFWELVLSVGNVNTTATNQTVNDLSIDNCAINTHLILNYSVYDEDDRFFLTNSTYNTTSNLFVKLSGDFTGTEYTYFSGSLNTNPITVCANETLVGGENYRLDSTIQYTADDYVTEFHYIENYTLNTSSAPVNTSLYLLATARSQEFLITFKDVNFIPLEGAIIELTREYLDLGQFLTVEIMKTDNDGKTIGHFVLNEEVYTILVKKNGQLRATYENVRAFCSDISTGDCRINLNEIGTTSNPSSFENYLGIIGSQSYNDTSKQYSFTFTSIDSSTKTVNVTLVKYDNYLNNTICTEQLSSSSGTINCNIGTAYHNSSALVEITVNGNLWGTSVFDITASRSGELTASRYLLAFFLIITLPLIAFTSGPMTIVLFIVGLLAAGFLALIDWGGYIGPFSAFLWFVVAALVILWKAASRRDV